MEQMLLDRLRPKSRYTSREHAGKSKGDKRSLDLLKAADIVIGKSFRSFLEIELTTKIFCSQLRTFHNNMTLS